MMFQVRLHELVTRSLAVGRRGTNLHTNTLGILDRPASVSQRVLRLRSMRGTARAQREQRVSDSPTEQCPWIWF